MEENCLLKELAMCFEEVRILGPKEMGWLGGGGGGGGGMNFFQKGI